MADYTATLYDTAVFGTTAGAEHTLFQVAQGGDSTHVEAFTNMRGAGSLPNDEDFRVDEIAVFPDVNASAADLQNMTIGSFLEVRVSDKTVLKAPLAMFMKHAAYGGLYTQATAANEALIGLLGDGYKLPIPIAIPGGTSFRVRIYQGTAMSAASQNLKVALNGVLTMP